MQTSSQSPIAHSSGHRDQPDQVNCGHVPLACLQLTVDLSGGSAAINGNTCIKIEEVPLRGARMDTIGHGYDFEAVRGGRWVPGMVDRKHFGVDNFSINLDASARGRCGTHTLDGIRLSGGARVWCWATDVPAAKLILESEARSFVHGVGLNLGHVAQQARRDQSLDTAAPADQDIGTSVTEPQRERERG